jgi:hypothetical protein
MNSFHIIYCEKIECAVYIPKMVDILDKSNFLINKVEPLLFTFCIKRHLKFGKFPCGYIKYELH